MIKKIVVDGNDGTGKSTRVSQLKKMFPNVEVCDRGEFSEATLNELIFVGNDVNHLVERATFYRSIKRKSDCLFIIVDASPETCQKRILERGDSIDVPYHNMDDLIKYHDRFLNLVELCKDLPNVMLVSTDD